MSRPARGDGKDALNLEQAAELLGLTTATLAKAAQAGSVPAWREADRWRFSRRVLIAWVTAQEGD